MHLHKTVAQFLLILSILYSALAAPAIKVREMRDARDAVVARVPAEGVAAVLEERLFIPREDPPGTSESTTDAPGSRPPSPPETPRPQTAEHPEPQSTNHPEPHSTNHPEPHSTNRPAPEEIFHDSSSDSFPLTKEPGKPGNGAPSNAVWRQKILTPEKLKAMKHIGGAGLLTAAYLSLLIPTIMKDD